MTDMLFLVFRTYFITLMTVGMMASMTEFRFKLGKLLGIMAVYSVWVIGSSIVILWVGGELLLLRLFFLTISIPATLLTYWAAIDTPSQAVFNYMTQILLSTLSASMIRQLTEFFHLSTGVNMLLMAVFYGMAIFLEWRFLRRPFRALIKAVPTRWTVLTLIPCAFCVYLIFMASWPSSYLENRAQMAYVYSALIPLVIVYVVVFKSLCDLYRIQMERHSAALLDVQINALKEKLQKVKEVEEGVRIQRHDLRHRLQTVTELVARGENDAALGFLNAAEKQLDEQKETRWCRPPVLDAVFSSYFHQADHLGIRVEANIGLPETLPVNESELAIVLANALENAIHANAALPQKQRVICCNMVGTPSVMLEISNPCHGKVTFDHQNLPVARKEGHGLGVQSISAFCRKNGAVCQFDVTDGWFRFRLIL